MPAAIPIYAKKPSEVRTVTFDFVDKLVDGDALTGSATMTYASGLTEVVTARVGNRVFSRCSGGTEDTVYLMRCACATSSGDTLILDAFVQIESDFN